MTDRLTIRRPDDWHVHLRDGAMMNHVARYTARQFARAIVMPNLSPPVTTAEEGAAYRDRIRAATPGKTVIARAECYRLTRSAAFVRGLAHDGDPADPVARQPGDETGQATAGAVGQPQHIDRRFHGA